MGASATTHRPGRSIAAITGLGMTETGKVYGRTAPELAAEAVLLAAADAGLARDAIDGLLISAGIGGSPTLDLARDLGLRDLRLLQEINCFGASAGAMVAQASLAVAAGMADAVACVWADAPLRPKGHTADAYTRPVAGSREAEDGLESLGPAAGLLGPTPYYALAARRHMNTYGTTTDQLGAVAVQARAWAQRNPLAQMRDAMTLADHHASRMIAEPLRLLDCCLVSNGGIAVIVCSPQRARELARPAVHVHGFGQGHPGYAMDADSAFGLSTGAGISGATAMGMAGIAPADVDVCELYDCFTITTLLTLEDYGFCAKGEGGPFVESGAIGPGGALPVNTGGGQLSSYYLWGFTPLSEAVIQARGDGGERQVDGAEIVLVSGNGGRLDHHSTVVLSPLETL